MLLLLLLLLLRVLSMLTAVVLLMCFHAEIESPFTKFYWSDVLKMNWSTPLFSLL